VLPLLLVLVPAMTADDPLPEGAAVLVAHSVLKSEDGKQSVQLATFGFALTKKDIELLTAIMNSDGYWHHFRMREVYLRVGEKVFAGGPRLTELGVGLLPRKDPPPKFGWTATFVLPGDVTLAGTELTFHDTDGNSKPGARFAKLELKEKDVKAASVPLRVAIREAGKFSDPLDDNREVHYLVLAANFYPPFTELRVGEAKPRRFPYEISLGEGRGSRVSRRDELIATFTEAPPADAAVLLKFRDAEGWYKAETVVEKPKEKK
jgi:hypothetical protein